MNLVHHQQIQHLDSKIFVGGTPNRDSISWQTISAISQVVVLYRSFDATLEVFKYNFLSCFVDWFTVGERDSNQLAWPLFFVDFT